MKLHLLPSLTLLLFPSVALCADPLGLNLTYLERSKIHDAKEPSGLALAHDRNGLWIVSDNDKKIFRSTLKGKVKLSESIAIPDKKLEGITLDPSGKFAFAVKEGENEVLKIDLDSGDVVERKAVIDMIGYDAIEAIFTQGGSNKGLEGITWNAQTGTLFLLKERPGLLLEVSPDMESIKSHRLLKGENGFRDDDTADDKIDFSGICYDTGRDRFWIVSDKAKRLFEYDWSADAVTQGFALGYGKDGKYREIEKAEGVAVDAEANRLYVVSDEEVRLYIFDLR